MGQHKNGPDSGSSLTTRKASAEDVDGIVSVYQSHIFSLLVPITKKALVTPSSLWIRGILLPLFAYYLTSQTYSASSPIPYIATAGAAFFVGAAVFFTIYMQLHMMVRKAAEADLNEKLPLYFSDAGACFLVAAEPGNSRLVGCVGLKNQTGGQGEIVYLAVRPDAASPSAVADALVEAAVGHARKGSYSELIVKLNSAEVGLLNTARVAGFGEQQVIPISAWFQAYRLALKLRRGH